MLVSSQKLFITIVLCVPRIPSLCTVGYRGTRAFPHNVRRYCDLSLLSPLLCGRDIQSSPPPPSSSDCGNVSRVLSGLLHASTSSYYRGAHGIMVVYLLLVLTSFIHCATLL